MRHVTMAGCRVWQGHGVGQVNAMWMGGVGTVACD
jgi:hypothetical protein